MFTSITLWGTSLPSLLVNDRALRRCPIQSWYYHPLPMTHFTCGMFQTGYSGAFHSIFPAFCFQKRALWHQKVSVFLVPYEYFQRAQPLLSTGPNLICVSKTELRTRSGASRAALLVCSGIWKPGTLVWSMRCVYISLKSGADSTRGSVVIFNSEG